MIVTFTGNTSLEAIRDQINAADAGVAASIINDGSSYRLVVRSEETGTDNALTVTDSTNLNLDVGANEINPAADAQLLIDGIAITSSSNKVTGAIAGVTLDLKQTIDAANPTPIRRRLPAVNARRVTYPSITAPAAYRIVHAPNSWPNTSPAWTAVDNPASHTSSRSGGSRRR